MNTDLRERVIKILRKHLLPVDYNEYPDKAADQILAVVGEKEHHHFNFCDCGQEWTNHDPNKCVRLVKVKPKIEELKEDTIYGPAGNLLMAKINELVREFNKHITERKEAV